MVAHGVLGLCVATLTPWKSVIARRCLQKKRSGTTSSLLLSVLVILSLLAGVAHSLGFAGPIAGVSVMQIHVGTALLAVPFALSHLIRRPTKIRRETWFAVSESSEGERCSTQGLRRYRGRFLFWEKGAVSRAPTRSVPTTPARCR